ncbi:hypothetical protein [Arcobacter aquimarinus]|uniref:Transformation system protein n=1 Tax=Arcobacter aquimarinus TaxID=1315211 RepID=A0AAE7E1G2_9BACT|nr:hypothetical protein [Arcobacter aquimarinus]QKE26590.1 hypothetical protein AAQM_1852 [Arcobacter aquimarinus]
MLNYFNNNFLKSNKKTKIELYILPLLICVFLYLFFLEKGKNEDVEISSKLNYEEFYNKKFESSFLELFSSLEKLAKKYEILILKNEKDKNIILLKAQGKKQSILNFIKDIENLNNFTKIDFFNMNKNEETKNYIFELKINLNKYYIKNLKEIEYEKKYEKVIATQNSQNKEFRINAIVDDFAFINETWIKKNEKIEDYKLIKIDRNFVVLSNESNEIKLELLNEEYFKENN